MKEEQEEQNGYYLDKFGNWQPDRRAGNDRRGLHGNERHPERRMMFRRKIDRELLRQDHDDVEDALGEFAEEHGGHL